MADIIDFNKNKKTEDKEATAVKPGKFEFHPHGTDEDHSPEVILAEGYLKFGPAFIAVVDGPEDVSNVLFAIQTGLLKYVKRLSEDDSIQATLSV